MSDLINRQDAIDMMVEMLADATACMMPKDLWREVVTEQISKLPSAHLVNDSQGFSQGDYISRQDAIEAIYHHFTGMTMDDCRTVLHEVPSAQPEPITVNIDHELTQDEYEKLRKDMANAPIMLLPSIQPEQRTGEWQITDAYPHNVYCSECHKKFAQTHWAVWEDGSLPRNFCPNCGADMRGEQE